MNRKKLEKLADKLDTMYLTDCPLNFDDRNIGYRWFLCWNNTHTVYKRATNMRDMACFIEDVLEEGICLS